MKRLTDKVETYFIKVPTFTADTGLWTHTEFETREGFLSFLWSIFKEPGQYGFDATSSLIFNEQSRYFEKHQVYCHAPYGTKDFKKYWDDQKERCTMGAIVRSGSKTWYLTRYYYMWVNFMPIFNKEQNDFTYPEVRDAQYHMALYEDIAKYSYKHCAILKKRQIASSYFHMGRLINNFWFDKGSINKIGASLKDYINEKGSWRFLEEYRNFLNEHTAWYRPCTPDKVFIWEQKVEQTVNGRKVDKGNKSVIMGTALDKNPTNGVGGPCREFFHEEGGIAPHAGETLEYLLPALKSGMIYTGMFIIAGSVGDLTQCEPLKDMMERPDSKDVLAIETNLINEEGEVGFRGLFIPEQWSMPPCIDEFGNSLVEEAIRMILAEREIWKKDLTAEDYQLRISQKPMNIAEAFAHRDVSVFPTALVSKQTRDIKDKMYPAEYVDVYRCPNDHKPKFKPSKRLPIREFPVKTKELDKRGVIEIFERPVPGAPWGTYYASVDPVAEGKTTTSESLCSIYIYKNPVEVTVRKADGTTEVHIERDKIVASWCGRFDDINDTHELLELLIEIYNAWTVIENNVSLFIQHMIRKNKQKYLVPKNMIAFLRDAKANDNVFQDYGWKNTGKLFSDHMLNYLIEFMKEKIDQEFLPDGTIVKTIYGISRIPDIMAMVEAAEYRKGKNVDRLVALTALIAFAKLMQSSLGYKKRVEHEKVVNQPKVSQDFRKLKGGAFAQMGRTPQARQTVTDPRYRRARSGFKNLK